MPIRNLGNVLFIANRVSGNHPHLESLGEMSLEMAIYLESQLLRESYQDARERLDNSMFVEYGNFAESDNALNDGNINADVLTSNIRGLETFLGQQHLKDIVSRSRTAANRCYDPELVTKFGHLTETGRNKALLARDIIAEINAAHSHNYPNPAKLSSSRPNQNGAGAEGHGAGPADPFDLQSLRDTDIFDELDIEKEEDTTNTTGITQQPNQSKASNLDYSDFAYNPRLWVDPDDFMINATIPLRAIEMLSMMDRATAQAEQEHAARTMKRMTADQLSKLESITTTTSTGVSTTSSLSPTDTASTPAADDMSPPIKVRLESTGVHKLKTSSGPVVVDLSDLDVISNRPDVIVTAEIIQVSDGSGNLNSVVSSAFVPTASFGQRARTDLNYLVKFGLIDLKAYVTGGRGRPRHVARVSLPGHNLLAYARRHKHIKQ